MSFKTTIRKYGVSVLIILASLAVGLITAEAGWAIFTIIALEILGLKVRTVQKVDIIHSPTADKIDEFKNWL